jgi:putative SOS response-associated peptidase YedK
MCGRYVTPNEAAIERLWNLTKGAPAFPRSWNVAPGATVPLLRLHRETGELEVVLARWGLIPHWWKDAKAPGRTFNARAEEAAAKPLWRDAIRRGRCVIPAEGWYEWSLESHPAGPGNRRPLKQPWFIRRADGAPVGFAGLMAVWKQPQTGEWVTSCAILTLPASGVLTRVHERMPAALPRELHDAWLEPGLKDGTAAADLLRSTASAEGLEAYPVSPAVNSALVDMPELIQPLAESKSEVRSQKSDPRGGDDL